MSTDDSHEIPSLIFSENNNNKEIRMLSATIFLSAVRVNFEMLMYLGK